MNSSGFELLIVALVPFVFYIYAIQWMRHMRSVIEDIDIHLLKQIEQSQRHHRELMGTESLQGEAKRMEKLPPIKG